jgi:hypothetical protein
MNVDFGFDVIMFVCEKSDDLFCGCFFPICLLFMVNKIDTQETPVIDGGWHGINEKSRKSESFLAQKVSVMFSTYQKADEVRRQTSDYDQQKNHQAYNDTYTHRALFRHL